MTTHTSRRTAPIAILPLHHAVAAALGIVVLAVFMVLVGSLAQAMSSTQWPTSTPSQVRLPSPQPLPPVLLPPEHPAQTPVLR